MRLGRTVLAAATCLLMAMAAGGPTSAVAASPAWQIFQVSVPTDLVPGSSGGTFFGAKFGYNSQVRYSVTVTNVGSSPAHDVNIEDVIPSGIVAVPPGVSREEAGPEYFQNTTREACQGTERVVVCEIPEVAAQESFAVSIPIEVAVDAPSAVTNVVTVSSPDSQSYISELPTAISTAPPSFGFLQKDGLAITASDPEGGFPLAGSHPTSVQVNAEVSSAIRGEHVPSQGIREFNFNLPKGFVVNPAATPKCPQQDLLSVANNSCPPESDVGELLFELPNVGLQKIPVFNVEPPYGVPAELAFEEFNAVGTIQGDLSSGFEITASASELLRKFGISGARVRLWGDPSSELHDAFRLGRGCPPPIQKGRPCPVSDRSGEPFINMPTSCTESLELTGRAISWLGTVASSSALFSDRRFQPTTLSGCGELEFSPSISSKATSIAAESASGLNFSIHQPQNESPEGRATAALRNATVTLPEGMTLNPSAANGLGVCTEEQMGYAPEGGKVRFATTPQTCPNAAKVGTLEVHTPLLEKPQPGSIYVAKPFDNPFGSLLAIYLAVEDEETGIIAKLAGKVEPNPTTGRLTATFAENPELPIEDIDLHFFPGNRGALTTPLACGTAATTSTLTPWSTPEGADAHPSDSFQVGPGCSSSEAVAPKTASFTAGTVTPLAGAYSPFVLRLARPDASQHFTGIETTLPAGLLGRLAGIPYCPESGIAQAKGREAPERGKLEQASPSCPASSEVGSVQVTAGAGETPIPVSGHAYLAGPYKGAPLSLVVIVPAVAGPFDLGTVVDRVALNIGEYDARIHAIADPLPTILDGIPLDVRSIELKLDRPGFTLNPTSCEAKQIEGVFTTQPGQTQAVSNRFQVGNCERLAFKPSLKLSLKGATGRSGHPALKAVVTYPKKGEYANIARAQVALPHSEFLDQGNIGKACTKVLLAQRACPAKSIYGHAKAWTPLLEKPVEGPVYLVGGFGYKLPALVAELNGQIRVLLAGKVDTGKSKGIRNTFEAVPDAPVSRFLLELKGGKKYGLLENSEDLCSRKQVAGAAFRAQNGRRKTLTVPVANDCSTKGHRPDKSHR